jgi:hypothetical protein
MLPLGEFARQFAGRDQFERQKVVYATCLHMFDTKDSEVLTLFQNGDIVSFQGYEYRLSERGVREVSEVLRRRGI